MEEWSGHVIAPHRQQMLLLTLAWLLAVHTFFTGYALRTLLRAELSYSWRQVAFWVSPFLPEVVAIALLFTRRASLAETVASEASRDFVHRTVSRWVPTKAYVWTTYGLQAYAILLGIFMTCVFLSIAGAG